MTIKELVKHIARFEGKKHEASVGDIKEIIGLISDVIYKSQDLKIIESLDANGKRRTKRKKS